MVYEDLEEKAKKRVEKIINGDKSILYELEDYLYYKATRLDKKLREIGPKGEYSMEVVEFINKELLPTIILARELYSRSNPSSFRKVVFPFYIARAEDYIRKFNYQESFRKK